MPLEDLRRILEQAGELGVSFVLLAGGEPLLRADILDVTLRFPEIIFPLFTNGTLLSGKILDKLQPQKHVIPILSMEGWERETDERRGRGVFRNSLKAMQKLRDRNIFFGISLTVTRDNLDLVTGDSFIEEFMNVGCRLRAAWRGLRVSFPAFSSPFPGMKRCTAAVSQQDAVLSISVPTVV
jgi:sulfatase maturation enzyme AslB (radical SAM superfamily)